MEINSRRFNLLVTALMLLCFLETLHGQTVTEPISSGCQRRAASTDEALPKTIVLPSEVSKFQQIYGGNVYPLDDQSTGISERMLGDEILSPLYDLQGRRLDSQPTNKGIYIQNGKKYVVK